MVLYLRDGSYMFRQNNAILREQLGFFLSYFNVNMVGGKSWNVWYKHMCQRVMQRTMMEHYQVHTASWVPAGTASWVPAGTRWHMHSMTLTFH
jgi:hypothetical protein